MAHNINYNKETGKHSFYSRKEVAWHKLGQVVEEAQTSEEAIKLSGLDYNVVKLPIYADYTEEIANNVGKLQAIVPNIFATAREDVGEILGIVGSRYEIVQNSQAFDFIDSIVGSKQAIFETAGALGKGERIFVTAKLPSNIRIEGTDDIIEEYLLFTSSHDGSSPVVGGLTPVRVVCNNTLGVALKGLKNKISIRHTMSVHDKIKMGAELMGLSRAYSADFSNILNHLAKKQIADADKFAETIVENIIFTKDEQSILERDGVFSTDISTRKRNTYFDILDYMDKGSGQELHRGTALWLYNGISTYYNNGKTYKDNEDRLLQLTEGKSYKDTQKAFDAILNLT